MSEEDLERPSLSSLDGTDESLRDYVQADLASLLGRLIHRVEQGQETATGIVLYAITSEGQDAYRVTVTRAEEAS